jgi:hypothetical protein
MTKDEYWQKIREADEDYKKTVLKIVKEFADGNKKFEIGDIVRDNYTEIIIKLQNHRRFIETCRQRSPNINMLV